jgi:hypothetical protein
LEIDATFGNARLLTNDYDISNFIHFSHKSKQSPRGEEMEINSCGVDIGVGTRIQEELGNQH